MPKFGARSKANLDTCHKDLQTVLNEAIKYFDFSVIHGHRTPEEQFELFKKGRKEVNEKWVIADKKKIVTYKDGYSKKSKHNHSPSLAVDIAPYPIDWKDRERFVYLAGYIIAIARIFKAKGIIDSHITWGADWDDDTVTKDERFIDLPHFQIS